jgi:hypothetical protein
VANAAAAGNTEYWVPSIHRGELECERRKSITFWIGALGRVDKAHPPQDCGELSKAEEAGGGFVVARRDAPELLQQSHHALDAVAPGIAAPIQRARRFAVGLPRDDRARAAQV